MKAATHVGERDLDWDSLKAHNLSPFVPRRAMRGRPFLTKHESERCRSRAQVKEPPYSLYKVPDCKPGLEGSVIVDPPSREAWFAAITGTDACA